MTGFRRRAKSVGVLIVEIIGAIFAVLTGIVVVVGAILLQIGIPIAVVAGIVWAVILVLRNLNVIP